jgi:hypothetical protein
MNTIKLIAAAATGLFMTSCARKPAPMPPMPQGPLEIVETHEVTINTPKAKPKPKPKPKPTTSSDPEKFRAVTTPN